MAKPWLNSELIGNFRIFEIFEFLKVVDPVLSFKQLLQYLGSRWRLRTQNSSVGVIFDKQQNDQKIFQNFENFQ